MNIANIYGQLYLMLVLWTDWWLRLDRVNLKYIYLLHHSRPPEFTAFLHVMPLVYTLVLVISTTWFLIDSCASIKLWSYFLHFYCDFWSVQGIWFHQKNPIFSVLCSCHWRATLEDIPSNQVVQRGGLLLPCSLYCTYINFVGNSKAGYPHGVFSVFFGFMT